MDSEHERHRPFAAVSLVPKTPVVVKPRLLQVFLLVACVGTVLPFRAKYVATRTTQGTMQIAVRDYLATSYSLTPILSTDGGGFHRLASFGAGTREGMQTLRGIRPTCSWLSSLVPPLGIVPVLLIRRGWINYYLESEIPRTLRNESVAGGSIYFGAKHLMAYAQLCLVADELGRCVSKARRGQGAHERASQTWLCFPEALSPRLRI